MPELFEVRADYDAATIVVYHAFNDAIAGAALAQQRFVAPFSMHRMTWIKPSFLWLMHRSQWARKPNQNRILAIRVSRQGFCAALECAVNTSPGSRAHPDAHSWAQAFETADVHVQWDPERSLRGAALDHYSIQIGLGRGIIERYVHEWVLSISDETERVAKMRRLLADGRSSAAKGYLPRERRWPYSEAIARRIELTQR